MLVFILAVAFIVAWVALYLFVIRPKLVSFRYTAGIYAKLSTFEAGAGTKALLLLRGLKVATVGFAVSAAPVVDLVYEKASNADWSALQHADWPTIILFALGIIGPAVMVFLHQGAIAAASAATPVEPPSTVPPAAAK